MRQTPSGNHQLLWCVYLDLDLAYQIGLYFIIRGNNGFHAIFLQGGVGGGGESMQFRPVSKKDPCICIHSHR